MKVKFKMQSDYFKTIEETVDIDEEKIKGNSFYPKNMIYGKVISWAQDKYNIGFEIIDDRFPDGEMPYIDEATKNKLGW
jgi:hypothetical protein